MHLVVFLCVFSTGLAYLLSSYFDRSKTGDRMIDGDEASPHQFPYPVYILVLTEMGNTFLCSGSHISQNYVLTAAYCFKSGKQVQVILRGHNLRKPVKCMILLNLNIDQVTIHEDYDEQLLVNDIALIKLPDSVTLNECIQTIALAEDNSDTYAGRRAVITGWNLTENNEVPLGLALLSSHFVKSKTGDRIIDGDEASPHQFLYPVYILVLTEMGNTLLCVGSLISQNRVLTAAHCFKSVKQVQVILGGHGLSKPDECSILLDLNIYQVPIHEGYDEQLLVNDIALFKLPDSVTLNKCIQTIALPENNSDTYRGRRAVQINGWNLTENNEEPLGLALPSSHFVKSKTGDRIIDGDEASPHQFPYQVHISVLTEMDKILLCAGSLISQNRVLTVAHCFKSGKQVQVILGGHDLSKPDECSILLNLNIDQVSIHEYYDEKLVKNDIALIKLPDSVTLNECIQTVALPKDNSDTYAGQRAVVTGWGITESTEVPSVLRYVNINIITNKECQSKQNNSILSTVMCTSGEENTGTCHGDSGGPLVVDGVQVGIVSYGSSKGIKCTRGTPTIFTRISEYLDWIVKNSKENSAGTCEGRPYFQLFFALFLQKIGF